jgi:hypothetical protein
VKVDIDVIDEYLDYFNNLSKVGKMKEIVENKFSFKLKNIALKILQSLIKELAQMKKFILPLLAIIYLVGFWIIPSSHYQRRRKQKRLIGATAICKAQPIAPVQTKMVLLNSKIFLTENKPSFLLFGISKRAHFFSFDSNRTI